MSRGAVAAVDLGATSGRVVVGRVGPDRIEIEDVHRFPNIPVRTRDGWHWDLLELYRNVQIGLRKAFEREPGLISVGIDSWAVDYGLLRRGRLISSPYHYRDERTGRGVDQVHRIVDARALYAESGLQFLPFNTLYQLAVDQQDGLLDETTSMLLVPDLIAYWLTGEQRAEVTNASTTGLLRVGDREWNVDLRARLGLPASLLPRLVHPGETIGAITTDVARAGGMRAVDVVAVGSHDTASAVVSVPMTNRAAAYICSGTWSLIGIETDRPITTEESRRANFTNEGGVDGRNRYLKNVMGMWLINECLNTWRHDDPSVDLTQLLPEAATTEEYVVFDAEDPSLLPAGDMPTRIVALAPALRGASHTVVLRSILESLALAYAATLTQIQRVSGVDLETVFIVGGASQNTLLCQLIADRSGRVVHAGPVEATALGNILVQARAAGLIEGQLEDLRALVARSVTLAIYPPRRSAIPPGALE